MMEVTVIQFIIGVAVAILTLAGVFWRALSMLQNEIAVVVQRTNTLEKRTGEFSENTNTTIKEMAVKINNIDKQLRELVGHLRGGGVINGGRR